MHRRVLVTLGLALSLVAPAAFAQSDNGIDNANPNASFLRCGTRNPSDAEAQAAVQAHDDGRPRRRRDRRPWP